VLGTVVIHEVYPDGAAAIDGRLKPGDQVLEVGVKNIDINSIIDVNYAFKILLISLMSGEQHFPARNHPRAGNRPAEANAGQSAAAHLQRWKMKNERGNSRISQISI
jgi:hypothetical protein